MSGARMVFHLLVISLLFAGCGGGGGVTANYPAPVALDVRSSTTLVPNTYIVEVQTFGTTQSEIELEVQNAADYCRVRLQGIIKHLFTNALRGFVAVLPEGEIPARFFENGQVLRVQPDAVTEVDGFGLPLISWSSIAARAWPHLMSRGPWPVSSPSGGATSTATASSMPQMSPPYARASSIAVNSRINGVPE